MRIRLQLPPVCRYYEDPDWTRVEELKRVLASMLRIVETEETPKPIILVALASLSLDVLAQNMDGELGGPLDYLNPQHVAWLMKQIAEPIKKEMAVRAADTLKKETK